MADYPEARKARHGEKMVEIKVGFWTDDIAVTKGDIVPKHAWTSGVVRVERNAGHGVTPGRAVPFNSLLDLPAALEQALVAHGIVLHPSRKMRKYVAETIDSE